MVTCRAGAWPKGDTERMSDGDLHAVLANQTRVNDLHNIAGGLANVLNQGDATQILHQMARLQRSLAIEVAAVRADLTKVARHLLDQPDAAG